MDVSSVSAGVTASAQDRGRLNADFDQFLRLLTTQLQNQDPLSPMDTAEFTNQLVQFSGVEQQIKSNTLLERMIAAQALNMTALGVSFIGKNVEVEGKIFQGGNGAPLQMSYALPADAASGTVSILDASGSPVWSQPAELSAGLHTFTWNGLDSSGNPVPPGKYELRVAALTENSVSLNAVTYVPGYVDALESADDGTLLLNIGDQKIPLVDVRKISQPAS